MTVAVRGEPSPGQPVHELGRVRLVALLEAVGEPGQLWIGEPVAQEVGDRGVLQQVGDHVLGEPHIGMVTDG